MTTTQDAGSAPRPLPADADLSTALLASHPPTSPLPYHRLARLHPRHRWWRPIVLVLGFGGIYAVLAVAFMATAELLRLVPSLAGPVGRMMSMEDVSDPLVLLGALVAIALMLPSALLAQRLCLPPGARRLSSVTGRLRRGLLGPFLAWAALAYLPLSGASLLTSGLEFHLDSRALVLLVIIVAVVPFQAAAEEYAFRALPLQVLGAWVRHPAAGIIVPVPFFVAGHVYGVLGSVEIAVFAIVAGWLTWRTGGLEAAIALHVVNNVAVMSLGAVGLADMNATTTTWPWLLLGLGTTAFYVWGVERHTSRDAGLRHAAIIDSAR